MFPCIPSSIFHLSHPFPFPSPLSSSPLLFPIFPSSLFHLSHPSPIFHLSPPHSLSSFSFPSPLFILLSFPSLLISLLFPGLISKAVKTYFDRKAVKTRLKPVKTGLNRSKRGQNLKLREMCQGLWKNPVRWIYICPSMYGLFFWNALNLTYSKIKCIIWTCLVKKKFEASAICVHFNVTTQLMLIP